MKPVLVSLAWGDAAYQKMGDCLQLNAREFGMLSKVTYLDGAPERGVDAWRRKPQLMLEAMDEFKRPVLWVDLDTRIHRDPCLEQLCRAVDLAAYSSRIGIFEDGVVYADQTVKARQVLEYWHQRCSREDVVWTNLEFTGAIAELRPRILKLPPEYCWNPKWGMRERYGNCSPIIEPNAEDRSCCS